MKQLVYWMTGIMLLFVAGCASDTVTPTTTTEASTLAMVEVVTTAELTASWATSTAGVTITPVRLNRPLSTSTPPCENAPPTRMIIREHGQVMDNDLRPLNVRSGPSTEFRILGRLEVLDVFYLLDGPECGGEYVWYYIDRDDLRGWIAEGDRLQYYVEPYLPG